MAWLKNPLPETPFNKVVIGIKDIEIASGSKGTVCNHSWCVRFWLSLPPLLLQMLKISCHDNTALRKDAKQDRSNIKDENRLKDTICKSKPPCVSKKLRRQCPQTSAAAPWFHADKPNTTCMSQNAELSSQKKNDLWAHELKMGFEEGYLKRLPCNSLCWLDCFLVHGLCHESHFND